MMQSILRNLPRVTIFVVLAAAFAGCSSNKTQEAPQPAKTPGDPLLGTRWVASEILEQEAAAAESFVIFKDDDTISGSTGCNNFNGGVEINPGTIEVGLLASTRKMCSPAISGQETVFLEALEAARQWQLIGDTLQLRDENLDTVMELVKQETAD